MNEEKALTTLLDKGIHTLKGSAIGLTGTLGAGKTHLVKKLLKSVDPSFENQVQSPTFNICNVYTSTNLEVHHFDLYRVESEEELYDIEVWESISNPNIIIFIEWVDRFPELAAKCDILMSISVDETDCRNYKIKKN